MIIVFHGDTSPKKKPQPLEGAFPRLRDLKKTPPREPPPLPTLARMPPDCLLYDKHINCNN